MTPDQVYSAVMRLASKGGGDIGKARGKEVRWLIEPRAKVKVGERLCAASWKGWCQASNNSTAEKVSENQAEGQCLQESKCSQEVGSAMFAASSIRMQRR